jgi:uncharacterized Zn-finger protein
LLYCPICGRTFKTLGALKAHFNGHPEAMASAASRACPVCGRRFPTQRSRDNHACRRRDEAHVVWSVLTGGRTAQLAKWKRGRALQLLRSGYRLELKPSG